MFAKSDARHIFHILIVSYDRTKETGIHERIHINDDAIASNYAQLTFYNAVPKREMVKIITMIILDLPG